VKPGAPALLAMWAALAGGCVRHHVGPLPGAPADASYLEVDGVALRYLDIGEGPPVVLLHGFGSSLDIWTEVAPALAARHRVIAVDLKGFGWSGRPPGDYSPPEQARLVWRLLDARGVRDAAVVGHSWGASVALAMVLAEPARVRRVALYAAYVYEAQVPSFFLWARYGGVGEALFSMYYGERVEDRVPLAFYDQRYVTQARVDRAAREMARPGAAAAALAAVRGQRYAAVERHYQGITQPVLLLWGREDRVTPLWFGERLAGDLPRARLIVYPRCGHLPMVEAAAASTAALADFLAEDAR
jgi:pimeloyl-ACP methyl ester carboxylesterase